jgi:hypothetical protein
MYGYLKEHIGAFGPHEIRTLVAALDTAWESIQASGVTFETSSHAESARAILAKHIIEAALHGERDQRRLRDGALVALAKFQLQATKPRTERR